MEASLNHSSTAYNDFLQLKARHHSIYRDDMNGILAEETKRLFYQQVRYDVIRYIDVLQSEDVQKSSSQVDDNLDSFARDLNVQLALTPLYLVNCNRNIEIRSFRRRFGQWEAQKLPFQFYYILSCPTQEPEGFSERIVYELMVNFEDSQYQNLNYRRCEGSERLRIEPLPSSQISVNSCQEAFKKYFAGRFNLGNTSFEEYLQTGLPNLNWEYVVTTMKITSGKWDSELMEAYQQWLLDSFSATDVKTPKFLFFFIISLKNAHQPDKIHKRDLETLESVKRIVEQNQERAALIAALPPVPVIDFEDWLEMISDTSDSQKKEIINAIADRLSAEEKIHFESEDKLLNMERIKDFQERVYKQHARTY